MNQDYETKYLVNFLVFYLDCRLQLNKNEVMCKSFIKNNLR